MDSIVEAQEPIDPSVWLALKVLSYCAVSWAHHQIALYRGVPAVPVALASLCPGLSYLTTAFLAWFPLSEPPAAYRKPALVLIAASVLAVPLSASADFDGRPGLLIAFYLVLVGVLATFGFRAISIGRIARHLGMSPWPAAAIGVLGIVPPSSLLAPAPLLVLGMIAMRKRTRARRS